MTIGLKPYPRMKDSGVEWLGEVPEHWTIERGKSIFRCIDVRSEIGEEELLTVSSNRGVVPRRSANVTMFKAESYIGHKLCWPNDLVINSLWAWAGGLGISPYHGIISTAYSVYRPRKSVDPRFIHELVRSKPFHWELRVRSKGVWTSRLQLTDNSFLCAPFVIPPLPEQASIVRYLDHVDRRVRRLVRAKRKLIALLTEQKQAIIHRAVTRGLDPDVPLKDSGVEWLGEVPEHWEVRRLGRISRVFNGSTPSRMEPAYWQGGTVAWLSSSKVNDRLVETPSEVVTERAVQECSISLVPKGAVIIGLVGQGKTRGKASILGIEACISQNIAAIVLRSSLSGTYLHLFLTAFYPTIREFGRGGNQEALNCEIVSNLRVSIPPLDEQLATVEKTQALTQQIAAGIASAHREIELLNEYRTRLIADVVTGKLDVREAAAALPEADPLAADEEPDTLDAEAGADLDDLDAIPEEAEA